MIQLGKENSKQRDKDGIYGFYVSNESMANQN